MSWVKSTNGDLINLDRVAFVSYQIFHGNDKAKVKPHYYIDYCESPGNFLYREIFDSEAEVVNRMAFLEKKMKIGKVDK